MKSPDSIQIFSPRLRRHGFSVAAGIVALAVAGSVTASEPTVKLKAPIRLPIIDPVTSSAAHGSASNRTIGQPTSHRVPRWLPSGSSAATVDTARQFLGQARQEYSVGAWLSSEASTWQALQLAAEAIDQNSRKLPETSNQEPIKSAVRELQIARRAMTEARDFSGVFDLQDPHAIARIVRSHQTPALKSKPTARLCGTEASDCYLDYARVRLAAIAGASVDAAAAMDLLAAIYLNRNDAKTLPQATSLCLRRAAIQGQPENASLARNLGSQLTRVGLHQEAQWALELAMSIDPSPQIASMLAKSYQRTGRQEDANTLIAQAEQSNPQTNETEIKVPEITQLTPEEFASLSKSVVWSNDFASTSDRNERGSLRLASARLNSRPSESKVVEDQRAIANATPSESVEAEPPASPIERLKHSWKRLTQ